MQFEKGRTKTGGRTKGTPNKKNAHIKSKVLAFMDSSFEDVLKCFTRLKSKEKVEFWFKLLPYVLTKPMDIEDDYNLDALTDKEKDVIKNIDHYYNYNHNKNKYE